MRGQYIFATLNVACLLGQLTAKNDAVSNEGALWNPIPGDECNLPNDQYLMVNAENQNTFLQCSPAQRRPIGVWKAMPCPPGQTFQFGRQMCDFDLPNFVVTARSSSESTKQKYKRANAAPPVIVPTHISYVNQPCNSSYCFGGSVCDEEAKLCKCPHGTTSTNGSLYCHAMVDKVTLDEHDPLNAANRMQNASPGSSCKNGEQCIGGSMCNPDNGVCTCGDGTVGHQGVCTPLATKHKDEANDWKVETKPSLYASPGEFCDKGQHCQGGSVCSSVTLRCACPMGTKQSGSRCVDAPPHKEVLAAVGDYCDVNTDCINGAYCHSGPGRPRCECLSTHVETDRICLKVVYPGQHGCSNDKQCAAAYHGATCQNSVCTCPPGSTAVAQTCSEVTGELGTISFVEVIPKYPPVPTGSPPGGICSDLIRCLGGSLCNSGVCICPDKPMQVVDGRCVVIPQPIANTAIVEVHHQVGNQKTFVAVGSPCGATMICVGGAVCVDGICQCSKGLRQVLNRCVREPAAKVQPIVGPKVVLPQPIPRRAEAPYCLNDDMCNGHSICINSKCSCPAGTALLNDHCVPTVLDTFETPTRQSASGHVPCSRDEECSQGSMCVQGACKCPPGFRKLGDGSCRGTILDSLCTMDQNCGDQAICIKGRCQCPPGTVQHGGLCILLNPASARKLSPQRSPALAPLCPNEVSPVVDPVNHGYVRCNAETPCPIGSYCHASGGALDSAPFYCCPVNRRSRKWIRQA